MTLDSNFVSVASLFVYLCMSLVVSVASYLVIRVVLARPGQVIRVRGLGLEVQVGAPGPATNGDGAYDAAAPK